MVVDADLADAANPKLGKPRALFTTTLPDGSTFAPTADGQRFIVNEPSGQNPIKILRGVTRAPR